MCSFVLVLKMKWVLPLFLVLFSIRFLNCGAQCTSDSCLSDALIDVVTSDNLIYYSFNISSNVPNSTLCTVDSVLIGIPSCASITSTTCIDSMAMNLYPCDSIDTQNLLNGGHSGINYWSLKISQGCDSFLLFLSSAMTFETGSIILNGGYNGTLNGNCTQCNNMVLVPVACNSTGGYSSTFTPIEIPTQDTIFTSGTTGTTTTTTGTTGTCVQHQPQIVYVNVMGGFAFTSVPTIYNTDSLIFNNEQIGVSMSVISLNTTWQSVGIGYGKTSPAFTVPSSFIFEPTVYSFTIHGQGTIEYDVTFVPVFDCLIVTTTGSTTSGGTGGNSNSTCSYIKSNTYNINLRSTGFSQTRINVTTYDKITWTNLSQMDRTVYLQGGNWSTDILGFGQTSSAFNDTGFMGTLTFYTNNPYQSMNVTFGEYICPKCPPRTPQTLQVILSHSGFSPSNLNITKGDTLHILGKSSSIDNFIITTTNSSVLGMAPSFDIFSNQVYVFTIPENTTFSGCCAYIHFETYLLNITIDTYVCNNGTNDTTTTLTTTTTTTTTSSTSSTTSSTSSTTSSSSSSSSTSGLITTGPATTSTLVTTGLSSTTSYTPFPPVKIHVGRDCNHNKRDDLMDILLKYSKDINGNEVPDECEDEGRYTVLLYTFCGSVGFIALTIFSFLYFVDFGPLREFNTTARRHSE